MFIRSCITSIFAFNLGLVLASAGSAQADAVLLDFGTQGYAGTDSPGHADGLATGTNWNDITGDTATGIEDENGNPVVGLSLDFGTGTLSSINYANDVKPLSVDHAAYPHWGDDLGEDHVVRDSGDPAIALAVVGLDPGVYDFYLTAFRGDNPQTDTNANRDYNVRFTTSTTPVTDFSGLASNLLTNDNPRTVDTWQPGDNYITDQFTITNAGEGLYLYSNSTGFIGVMSSLQIVPVPEPGSVVLVGAGGLLMLVRRRRRAGE